ncbi:MAG: chromate transporter [Spirochaetaceae bacterium]|jgi:chromate transporter|nr:chromate transporter [Spirochaetaceae bacterium]
MALLNLFFTFFYVGLFTIGGGLVAITIMYDPIVSAGYITAEEFYNMIAISESTPGPIGINMATYVGFKLAGVPGAMVATCGTVLPSLISIVFIARFFTAFHEKPLVQAAFSGLRPATTGLIAVAAAKVLAITVFAPGAFSPGSNPLGWIHPKEALFFGLCCLGLWKTKLHPLVFVAAGAVFGALAL